MGNQAKDKYVQNCHGHAHLKFGDADWEKLKATVSSDADWEKLKATVSRDRPATFQLAMLNSRDSPEPDNRLKNCSELERFRLQIVEPQLMVEHSTKLAEKVDNVVSTLSETNTALSETNTKISQLINLLTLKEQGIIS